MDISVTDFGLQFGHSIRNETHTADKKRPAIPGITNANVDRDQGDEAGRTNPNELSVFGFDTSPAISEYERVQIAKQSILTFEYVLSLDFVFALGPYGLFILAYSLLHILIHPTKPPPSHTTPDRRLLPSARPRLHLPQQLKHQSIFPSMTIFFTTPSTPTLALCILDTSTDLL